MKSQIIGWNSWDPKGVNRFIQPELDLEIVIATMDVKSGVVLDEYNMNVLEERKAIASGEAKLPEEDLGDPEQGRAHKKQTIAGIPDWPMGKVICFGPRSLDLKHGYLKLSHDTDRGKWHLNISASRKTLTLDVDIIDENDDFRFVVIARAPWGKTVSHKYNKNNNVIIASPLSGEIYEIKIGLLPVALCCGNNHREIIERVSKAGQPDDIKAPAVGLVLPFKSFNLTYGPQGQPVKLEKATEKSFNDLDLKDAYSGIEAAVGWNLCWDALYKRIQLPVNKEWVLAGFKGMAIHDKPFSKDELEYVIGPAMFSWDAGFGTFLTAELDIDWAKEIAKSAIVYNRRPDGSFSTCRMGRHQTASITNPPILTWACGRIYERTGDKVFLADVYHDLKAWYFWMKRERDRNGDGLYEWGVNPQEMLFSPEEMAARLETGLDNSPMYYDVPYSNEFHTFAMNCIDLSSFQALCAMELSKMAKGLGLGKDVEIFSREHQNLKNLINEKLWDSLRDVYANRLWTGEFCDVITPTSFYPLLAEVPDKSKAEKIINGWINNPQHFGTEFAIASVDPAHPSYQPDGNYWRGRIWGPMNYLIYHGLRKYDRDSASIFAKKSLELFLKDWRGLGHIYENYSALTGHGLATVEKGVCTCQFYLWGALLALIGIEDKESDK